MEPKKTDFKEFVKGLFSVTHVPWHVDRYMEALELERRRHQETMRWHLQAQAEAYWKGAGPSFILDSVPVEVWEKEVRPPGYEETSPTFAPLTGDSP